MKILFLFFFFIISSLDAQVSLRKADPIEKEEILNNLITLYAKQYMEAGIFENENTAREVAISDTNEELRDDNTYYYYLTSEDYRTQYGYLVYSINGQTAYLQAIYIEERYQGNGLGKEALHIFELFLESDVLELKLYVFNFNKRAMELYKKIGYEIETTYYINDLPVGHHMKKNLWPEETEKIHLQQH